MNSLNIPTCKFEWIHKVRILLPNSCWCMNYWDIYKSLCLCEFLTGAWCGRQMCVSDVLFAWMNLLESRREKRWGTNWTNRREQNKTENGRANTLHIEKKSNIFKKERKIIKCSLETKVNFCKLEIYIYLFKFMIKWVAS